MDHLEESGEDKEKDFFHISAAELIITGSNIIHLHKKISPNIPIQSPVSLLRSATFSEPKVDKSSSYFKKRSFFVSEFISRLF